MATNIVLLITKDFDKIHKNEVLKKLIEGKELSTPSKINLNKVHGLTSETFTMLYKLDDFMKLEPITLYRHIVKLIEKNFKNQEVVFSYLVAGLGKTTEAIDDNLYLLDELFFGMELPNISYETSRTLREFLGDKYYYYSEKDDSNNLVKNLSKADKKKKKKKGKKKFGSYSKLVYCGKKSIKAHNIVVSEKKKYLKHDVKLIKGFLKDFIPQKTNWAKRYRNELLKRWLGVFVITPKMAKKIKKANKTIRFTRKRPNTDELFYDATK